MKRTQSIIILLFIILFALLLLTRPEVAASALRDGLLLCGNTVIPSLFPFLVLSSFIISSGFSVRIGRRLDRITRFLFKLSGSCGSVIIMGLLGGYPTGARMTAELFRQGSIDKSEAKRLMYFCVCSGPAFVISGVGQIMLGSRTAGLILFLSLVLSSLITGIISGMLSRGKSAKSVLSHNTSVLVTPNKIDAFVLSTANAAESMFSICAWVLVFSAFTSYLSLLPLSPRLYGILSCILEVTGGVNKASKLFPLPFICGALAFSGFAVHFQIMQYIRKVGMKYSEFLFSRLINAVMSFIICRLMLNVFPYDVPTFSNGVAAHAYPVSESLPASAGLIFMCILLLVEMRNLRQS